MTEDDRNAPYAEMFPATHRARREHLADTVSNSNTTLSFLRQSENMEPKNDHEKPRWVLVESTGKWLRIVSKKLKETKAND